VYSVKNISVKNLDHTVLTAAYLKQKNTAVIYLRQNYVFLTKCALVLRRTWLS